MHLQRRCHSRWVQRAEARAGQALPPQRPPDRARARGHGTWCRAGRRRPTTQTSTKPTCSRWCSHNTKKANALDRPPRCLPWCTLGVPPQHLHRTGIQMHLPRLPEMLRINSFWVTMDDETLELNDGANVQYLYTSERWLSVWDWSNAFQLTLSPLARNNSDG